MMLRFIVITLFPEMFQAVTEWGVTGRAVKAGLLEVNTVNPRDYTTDPHRTVDDRPYGGGPGMVMMAAPLLKGIDYARKSLPGAPVIYLSPQGKTLKQSDLPGLSSQGRWILLAGRYEGIDERVLESAVDMEISIGDYVLSGGELPAMVLIDALARLHPGVLGHAESAVTDSHVNGLLDHPHYTRPEIHAGQQAPKVLLDGNHAEIRRWRMKQSLGRTWLRRPDLLAAVNLDAEQTALLEEFINEYQQHKTS
jgi:tRNA (guanine37-N1)-methyltransferase